jgi:hypothetical protein
MDLFIHTISEAIAGRKEYPAIINRITIPKEIVPEDFRVEDIDTLSNKERDRIFVCFLKVKDNLTLLTFRKGKEKKRFENKDIEIMNETLNSNLSFLKEYTEGMGKIELLNKKRIKVLPLNRDESIEKSISGEEKGQLEKKIQEQKEKMETLNETIKRFIRLMVVSGVNMKKISEEYKEIFEGFVQFEGEQKEIVDSFLKEEKDSDFAKKWSLEKKKTK